MRIKEIVEVPDQKYPADMVQEIWVSRSQQET
jgi:hypothetical protein